MTHPTHHTNGASLEDCHTNFFALMDLCGIKWRRLGAENVLCDEPLDDPVLLSYGRCLASDILCVWRRVQPTSRSSGGGGGAGNGYMLDHHGGQRGFHDLQVPPPSNHGHHGHGHHLQHHGTSGGHGSSNGHHHSIFKKELWIFWYGEEPDLTNILCTELAELDQGNWESGLSYECRTLLFKAIHNRIERSFLSREHVRLGKWFVQPYDAREKPELKSPHSLSFTFFIHGESTVCVCVDVREPPLVTKLGLQHVLAAQGSHNGLEVILSPYGQAGVLTGQVYKDSDAAVQKLLDEWRQFYPIDAKLSNREVGADGVQMPAFVEVIVGGVRLRYPSCYVLLPEDDAGTTVASTGTSCPLAGAAANAVAGTSAACNGPAVGTGGIGRANDKANVPAAMSSVSLTPPTSPCDAGMMSMPSGTAVVGGSSSLLPGSSSSPPGAPYASCGSASGQDSGVLGRERPSLEITSHAYQDSTLFGVGSRSVSSNPNPSQTAVNQQPGPPSTPSAGTGEVSSREDTVGTWDFYEPTQKAVCSCPKCRKPRSSGGSVKSGSATSSGTSSGTSVTTGSGGGAKKCEKQQQSRHLRHMTPFHRRSPVNEETAAFETDVLTGRASSTPATHPFKGGAVPRSATPSGLPQLRSIGGEQPTSVGSPASAAPSPLVASSHSQPASVTQPDAALPALSPHPAMASQEPQETASGQQQQQDEPMNVESHEAQQQQDAYGKEGGPKSAVEQVFSPFPAPGSVATAPASVGVPDSSNQVPSVTCNAGAKQSAEVANWVQMQRVNSECVHPGLKRPVLPATSYEDLVDDEPLAESLYDYTSLNAWLQHPVKKFKPDALHRQNSAGDGLPSPAATSLYKREPSTPQALGGSDSTSPKPTDPYEFVDDFPTTVSMAGFKCKNETNKDDEKAKDGTPQTPLPQCGVVPCDNGEAKGPQPVQTGACASQVTPGQTDLVGSPPAQKPQTTMATIQKLYRERDRKVTYEDLEQLFDTSDDDTYNEGFHMPSPPGSVKTMNYLVDDTCPSKNKTAGGISILGPTELSRMFPTPPSLEQASPCAQTNANDGPSAETDVVSTAIRERCDIYPSYGSPMDETGRDWSYVFKTPVVVKFWGSSKYAPLATLPSQMLPPLLNPPHVVYKPSWQYPPVAVEKQHLPHVASQPLPAERAGSNHCAPSPAANSLATTGHGHHQSGVSSAMSGYELTLPPSAQPTVKNLLDAVSLSSIPEAHSLLVNLALSDSVLNLFRDHNFDSCTMCVCHMNVKGSDVGLYLPDTSVAAEEPPYKCSCGFSAVVNRRFGHRAGLFYEDEAEIGGSGRALAAVDECCSDRKRSLLSAEAVKEAMASSALDPEATNPTPQYVLELLQTQCSTLFSPCSTFSKACGLHRRLSANAGWGPGPMAGATPGASLHVLDGSDVTALALESVVGQAALKSEDARKNYLHKWPFLPAKLPCNSHDTVRLLRALQPLLQEAIHKKLTTQFWEATTTATYNVSGPLTWRQFLKLAGRSTEDQCEPQPIPSLLVGYDKDWIALSPFALKYWEKLLLEPYSLSRDVAYIVVAPDNEYVIGKVKTFFKELSGTYEVCRLGRHVPIAKVLRDGIMRVGKTAAKKLADQPVDEWFNLIGDSPVAAKLKLYAQVCRHHLAPHLALQPLDRTLLDPPPPQTKVAEKVVPAASPMPPPSTPENPDKDKAATPKPVESVGGDAGDGSGGPSKDGSGWTGGSQSASGQQGASGGYASGATVQDPWEQDDDPCPPAIVIYMVDPFTYACDNPAVHRLVMLGLMRCYSQMLCYLPESMQNNINLQIIPQESILETSFGDEKCKQLDRLKSLAFSVFSQCHRILAHQSTVKSLTGFGTAAAAEQFLKAKDKKNSSLYRMYSPPFILAPMKDKQTQLGESFGDRREKCTILFCTYCISEDQRWLLGTCTDDRGEILETCTINVEIPNRHRRKKASARKIGLQKLMDWILGVMSTSVMPWRLVVGRLGRLGQGELKGWSSLLSRKTLLRASKHLREICKMCMFMSAQDAPCILSACLVSLEADTVLRIMPDQFSPDEDFGSSCNSCNLSTPQDASCTHILVFPTSATTQSSQVTCQQDPIDTLVPNFPEEILEELDEEGHPMSDINAFFNWTDTSPGPSPQDSPRRESSSRPGSPGLGMSERHSPFHNGGFNRGVDDLGGDLQEEAPQPLQQPLALAYYVSTARAGPLPKWFWSSCGHLEEMCPAFLKSALHVHSPAVQQSSDDLFQQQSHPLNYHPLDSNLTTDVLRYVLEGYNALSWLSIDPATHDRRSCLPVHIQVLMQMYFAMAALV